jgi:hypothetical protein
MGSTSGAACMTEATLAAASDSFFASSARNEFIVLLESTTAVQGTQGGPDCEGQADSSPSEQRRGPRRLRRRQPFPCEQSLTWPPLASDQAASLSAAASVRKPGWYREGDASSN